MMPVNTRVVNLARALELDSPVTLATAFSSRAVCAQQLDPHRTFPILDSRPRPCLRPPRLWARSGLHRRVDASNFHSARRRLLTAELAWPCSR